MVTQPWYRHPVVRVLAITSRGVGLEVLPGIVWEMSFGAAVTEQMVEIPFSGLLAMAVGAAHLLAPKLVEMTRQGWREQSHQREVEKEVMGDQPSLAAQTPEGMVPPQAAVAVGPQENLSGALQPMEALGVMAKSGLRMTGLHQKRDY